MIKSEGSAVSELTEWGKVVKISTQDSQGMDSEYGYERQSGFYLWVAELGKAQDGAAGYDDSSYNG